MHRVASAREDLAAARAGRAVDAILGPWSLLHAAFPIPIRTERAGLTPGSQAKVRQRTCPAPPQARLPAGGADGPFLVLWERAVPSQRQAVQDLVLRLQMSHRAPGCPQGTAGGEKKPQPTCRGLSSSACPPVGQHTIPATPEPISRLDPQGGPRRESSSALVDTLIYLGKKEKDFFVQTALPSLAFPLLDEHVDGLRGRDPWWLGYHAYLAQDLLVSWCGHGQWVQLSTVRVSV
jgi:hypothetical protein